MTAIKSKKISCRDFVTGINKLVVIGRDSQKYIDRMRIYFIFILTVFNGLAFTQTYKDEIKNVEGFIYNNKSKYLSLFEKKYSDSHDSIQIPNDSINRILIIVDKIEKNWIKIKYIRYAPVADSDSLRNHRGKWIKNTDLYFNIGVTYDIQTKVYETASKAKPSEIIKGFQRVKIVTVKKSWAKVEYTSNGNKKTGWIAREDQCSYFWTACNWIVN